MAQIKHLPKNVIAAIAAGEVAESPASVVKELVENAVDAGATQVDIKLTNSGLDFISVSDNGLGMDEKNLEKCWLRHTTSKISNLDHLSAINSFGFRGEALASIAGVSSLEIKSKTKEQESGFLLVIEHNKFKKLVPVAARLGTTVVVRDLFGNVPARKKFISQKSAEFRKVVDEVSEVALAYPEVGFELIHNHKNVLRLLPEESKETRIGKILGKDLNDLLLVCDQKMDELHLTGFLGKPQLARSNKNYQFLFVNGRFVVDFKISKTIRQVFGSMLEHQKYPVFILNLSLPADQIDINIHPHKKKVDFANFKRIKKFVTHGVSQTLEKNNLDFKYYNERPYSGLELRDRGTINHTKNILKSETQLFTPKKDLSGSEILQIDNTYLVVPGEGGLMLIDQHAAHERVLFEQFRQQFLKRDFEMITLKKKVEFKLGIKELGFLKEYLKVLLDLGFDFEISETKDKQKVELVAIADLLLKHDFKKIVLEILDELAENDGEMKEFIDSQTIRVLNFLACRNAIMAGEFLSAEERMKLVKKLNVTKGAYTCPHGRPFKITLSIKELEKIFHRA